MKNLEALINDGGSLGIGPIGAIECTATADDGQNAMAMLVRRDGETLRALLKRLGRAAGASSNTTKSPTKSTGLDPRGRVKTGWLAACP